MVKEGRMEEPGWLLIRCAVCGKPDSVRVDVWEKILGSGKGE